MPLNTPNERAHALDEIRGFTRSLRPEIISFYEPLVSSLLGIDAHQLHLGANSRANNGYNAGFKGSLNYQNNVQNGANFRQNYNASKGHQNQQNARYQSPQNAPANALKTQENKDMLRLSILKNIGNPIAKKAICDITALIIIPLITFPYNLIANAQLLETSLIIFITSITGVGLKYFLK